MKGPFYSKNESGNFVLFDCCKDCAFAEHGEKDKEATCFMDPCPCMPIIEEEDDG